MAVGGWRGWGGDDCVRARPDLCRQTDAAAIATRVRGGGSSFLFGGTGRRAHWASGGGAIPQVEPSGPEMALLCS